MKRMTEQVRQKIVAYRKNKLDISDLIKGVDIRNEDLSRCIIKTLEIINGDISNCNFSEAIIGEEGKQTILVGTKMVGCNFKKTVFKGTATIRHSDASNCNMSEMFAPFLEYQYANLRGCNLCDAVIRVGSRGGHAAILDDTLFKLWGINIVSGNKKLNKKIDKQMGDLKWIKNQCKNN